MKKSLAFVARSILAGLLLLIPIYLAVLVLLKGMGSVAKLVRPFAKLLPEWMPAEQFLSLLLVLFICFLIGVGLRTRKGRMTREQIESGLFGRIPGYALFRSLTQQVAGDNRQNVWKPALAEIEDALVPAFIIEELDDGRFTIFVPSIPTPLAGAVYILDRKRVHPLNVSFTDAFKTVSRWGSGAKDLVAAMEENRPAPK
ncbi:MAG TPA: hypothetical protein VIH35_01320 [Kiritimatiellia bacterium]|jgi:uncharacterized membrane protein